MDPKEGAPENRKPKLDRIATEVSDKEEVCTESSTTGTTHIDTAASIPNEVTQSPTAVSTAVSSWSASDDRQLGHGNSQDPADRVFPIRSVISVGEPGTIGRKSSEQEPRRKMSLSDPGNTPILPTPGVGNGQQLEPHSEPASFARGRSTVAASGGSLPMTPAAAPWSPPAPNARERRQQTVSGSLSSIQADAERYGNPMPLSLADSSDDEQVPTETPSRAEETLSKRKSSITPSIPDSLYTTRFTHVMTQEGHAVITGRDGKLQRCEDEPIHTPGAVQGFGMLLSLREDAEGRLQVRHVSENSHKIIGYRPRELFGLGDFLDILSEEQADNLLDHIDFIRDEDADPASNGPEVFSLSLRPPGQDRSVKLWCAIHTNPAHPNLIVCEFELDNDVENPLRPADEETPNMPEDTLQSNPTLEELTESTEILSKPLRVLRSARKRRGEAGAMQVFDIMSQVQEQLANAPNLEVFLKILVGIVKELTGFHRVMIYQFDSMFNGKVVTELVDPALTRDLYKGLHFPASDIPKQARELYKLNKVRLLYDRDLETARIVCRSTEDLEVPLDMTHSYLRAMSPIHLKYLANMAVRSSMSISINAFGDLWGLIACHSYGPKGMRVSFPIRKMCRLVGDTVSRNIERLSYASRLQARKLINTVPTEHNPSGYIIASSDDLLKLFDADFGMLSIREETKILGKIDHSQEALAMLEYLRVRKFTSVLTSQDVNVDFPDLHYPPGFQVIAGLLYVPLSVGGNDFIVFFRRGQIKEVKWAGNPYEKTIQAGTEAYLQPRTSFKVWNETVVGKSRDWSEEQVETAAVLCLVYGKFIEVWRQKEAALQSSRLTRLLLANSAHEVRTPLNAIINYLEIAMEGSLDQETRDNLSRSHSASKSLIYVINDLLDLTKTEEGQELVKDEIFDLPACIRAGTEPFKNDAKRKGIEYEFIEHPGLPKFVYGDQRRVRQAVANVTANAVQHTSTGFVRVELYLAELIERRVRVEIVVQDTGAGMSNTQLDALFRDLEQVSSDEGDDMFSPIEASNDKDRPQKDRTLGLGLAVVARILRNMDGQLRLKSELGKGSRFVMQLPFELPEDTASIPLADGTASSALSETSTRPGSITAPSSARATDGEVIVVNRGSVGSNSTTQAISPKKSFDDARSTHSHRSIASKSSARSGMSDADRLIDAIQTPITWGELDPELAKQRRSSRGAYYNAPPPDSRDGQTTRSLSPTGRVRPSGPARSGSSPINNSHQPQSFINTSVSREAPPGMQFINDSKTPLKPVRIPDDFQDKPSLPQQSETSGILFEIPPTPSVREEHRKGVAAVNTVDFAAPAGLEVLVAEDDPINLKVLRKRLEKAGHKVSHALNGEDCATMYGEKTRAYDVVLMDMQMPIVDGLTSTKMIRSFETLSSSGVPELSAIARNHGRIPIIAVSASLVEREKETYVEAGFDGWILKPIDFKRLEELLRGIVDDGVRERALYVPGEWERGGWFDKRREQGVGKGETMVN
ncbi:putative signal transduction histidine-protein kinase [Cercophora samala]|uniref:Signal transduction histidine-protein kinase n=1 Tax=Cercophora samala TaxID=330535 RepID=A0AA39ZDG6_9PEZI|nr:putative signal transduction histidine-protein kinase [Cercophora samala]